jgi:hypothetical protein
MTFGVFNSHNATFFITLGFLLVIILILRKRYECGKRENMVICSKNFIGLKMETMHVPLENLVNWPWDIYYRTIF